ncbi:aldo-keto reductase family protein [Skeletonema marinoi]|uniref:Aldo-keto reductase family protein n=1 Tax=Skeletonema marinoi TaxID=267567 RepID=A0AAD9D6R7_9STRA|nr:aldo-keto reductase family protein [Skeletonema marinoi]
MKIVATAMLGTILCTASLPKPSAAVSSRTIASFVASSIGRSTSSSPTTTSRNMMSTQTPEQKQSLIDCPTIPLRDGTSHPAIGFGTYKLWRQGTTDEPQRTAEDCVTDALNSGYRFLSAQSFMAMNKRSEKQSKQVVCLGRICSYAARFGLRQSRRVMMLFEHSWRRLSLILEQITLIFILSIGQCPGSMWMPTNGARSEEGGQGEKCWRIKYAVEDYKELLSAGITSEDKPVVNQIEINPFLYRKNTIDISKVKEL